MARTYFVMFDPECGRAVPDARARRSVEAHWAEWCKETAHEFRTDIIGTAYLLAAYIALISEAQNAHMNIVFIDPNNQPLKMSDITETISLSPMELLDQGKKWQPGTTSSVHVSCATRALKLDLPEVPQEILDLVNAVPQPKVDTI